MAMFSEGDYVFLPNDGPRARIERVVQDSVDENQVIYFIVSYDKGACGCISGAGMRRDFTGLPSDKIADQKTLSLRNQVEALKRGLATAPAATVPRIEAKSRELDAKIAEIERLWRPRYFSAGLQPFNNLEPVQNIIYVTTILRRMPTDYYYCERNGVRVEVDSRQEGMEFVILMSEPQTILVGTVGHSPMALGRPTIFAGHVIFDRNGKLLEWNNNTGHYKTVTQYKHQAVDVVDATGTPLLPIHKYRNLY